MNPGTSMWDVSVPSLRFYLIFNCCATMPAPIWKGFGGYSLLISTPASKIIKIYNLFFENI